MTDSFGARLRRERERQHIALADIAERTKIKASLFEALERDDISHWPAGIFRRSFMRAYANALGLDADAAVREFLQRFPDPSEPDPPGHPSPGAARAATPAPAAVEPPAAPRPTAADISMGVDHKGVSHNLRLTLVETGLPFTGGRFLADARRRWSAAAWDLGSLIAIAISLFIFTDTFWMPFGLTALCYYIGGVLILGNSPGVCLFAPKPTDTPTGGSRPARVPRHRAVDAPPVRAAEASFRAARFRRERAREVPN
jgi:transcriptional regulator with XRE-family HTH domain